MSYVKIIVFKCLRQIFIPDLVMEKNCTFQILTCQTITFQSFRFVITVYENYAPSFLETNNLTWN